MKLSSVKRLGIALMFSFLTGAACGITPAEAVTLPDPVYDEPLSSGIGAIHTPRSIVIAGGCFWGIQGVFQHTKGVLRAISGYAGNPDATAAHYDLVSSGKTGNAESVEIIYDPTQITLGKILKIFFAVAHNPTELNRQGPDHGTQYRSAIFYTSPEQQKIAQAYIDQLQTAKVFADPIVTTLEPLKKFYAAETYHQDYMKLNPYSPYIMINDAPKVSRLKEQLPDLYVEKARSWTGD